MGWINSRDVDEIVEKNKSINIKDKITKIINKNKNESKVAKNSYETKTNKTENQEKNKFLGKMIYI